MDFDLHGRAALVTGAGRRLGKAFAEALAAHGADVVIHYGRSAKLAEALARQLQEQGVRAVPLQADLADPHQAAALLDRAVEAFGEVHYLVNNASIFEPLGVMDTDPAAWRRHLDVNLTAPFLLSQAFARHRAGQPGAIVNLLDWRALRPGADHFPYTIAKAALAAMTRSLAVAFAPNVRVNGLALGAILPPPEAEGVHKPEIIRQVPAGRWGEVEEVCHALLFLLAGPEYVTGQIVHVDGGRHLV